MFLDKLRVTDSKGQASWTNTLSVLGFLLGALYVIAVTAAGFMTAVPEWMSAPYTQVILVLVGAVSANMAVRNIAVHWGNKAKEELNILVEAQDEEPDAKESTDA